MLKSINANPFEKLRTVAHTLQYVVALEDTMPVSVNTYFFFSISSYDQIQDYQLNPLPEHLKKPKIEIHPYSPVLKRAL